MIYRLVTTWRDDENSESPIIRGVCDFSTRQDAEAFVASVVAAGVFRLNMTTEPMENGARLATVFTPIQRVIGWFVWELPDNTPMWPGVEIVHNA